MTETLDILQEKGATIIQEVERRTYALRNKMHKKSLDKYQMKGPVRSIFTYLDPSNWMYQAPTPQQLGQEDKIKKKKTGRPKKTANELLPEGFLQGRSDRDVLGGELVDNATKVYPCCIVCLNPGNHLYVDDWKNLSVEETTLLLLRYLYICDRCGAHGMT